jgi:hypothetical protein
MNIFKSDNSRKTAKEHIIQKRNINLFLDISKNNTGNGIACVKSKKITKFNNHSNLLNVTHGFYDYFQNGKCTDICNNLLSKNAYDVEVFRNKPNPVIKNSNSDNNDLSNNYAGIILTNQFLLDYPNSTILDSSENSLKLYSNIEEITGNTIELKRNTKKTKCFKIKTNDILIQ